MPGIAKAASARGIRFYWHLGDLRWITELDEDIRHRLDVGAKPPSHGEYLKTAWNDFIERQIKPFGSVPFYVGIGNHETVPPKTRREFVQAFGPWLDAPTLRAQRLKDDAGDQGVRTYYHWTEGGVDFIYLDNATPDQFDDAQLAWFEAVLGRDAKDPSIKILVVGMHEALPQSISSSHSMDQSLRGETSGLRAYQDLLKARDEAHKRVYILASHSHYYMKGTYDTRFWRAHGGVLPGWIVGTAGAYRYALPPGASGAAEARTRVYGYLLGRVEPSGEIRFEFQPLEEAGVPAEIAARYEPGFVHWCFAENAQR